MVHMVTVSVLVDRPFRRGWVGNHVAGIVLPVVVAVRRVDQGSHVCFSFSPSLPICVYFQIQCNSSTRARKVSTSKKENQMPEPFRARGAKRHLVNKLPCEMWREVLSCGKAATLSRSTHVSSEYYVLVRCWGTLQGEPACSLGQRGETTTAGPRSASWCLMYPPALPSFFVFCTTPQCLRHGHILSELQKGVHEGERENA